jgi:hypothetical protein
MTSIGEDCAMPEKRAVASLKPVVVPFIVTETDEEA